MSSRWSLLLILGAGLILISPAPEALIHAVAGGHGSPAEKAPPAEAGQEPAPAKREQLPGAWHTVAVLLEKFGEALIIAAFLGWAVDEAVKRSLVAEITRDVLDFAVGFELPEEVKEQVRYVLRLPFVRRNVRMTYEFKTALAGGVPAYVEVLSKAEYEVTNLTGSSKYFDFKSSIETRRGEGMPGNRLLRMEAPSQKRVVTGAELEKLAQVEGPYTRAKIPVEIKGGKSGAVTFRTERQAYYRLDDAIVLDILEPPCIGVTVKVVAPAEFDFRVSFGSEGPVTGPAPGGPLEWKHAGVHLPGSHFRVQWEWKGKPPGAPQSS